MNQSPTIDLLAAHRWFAANCFNETWALLDKPDRTLDDERRLIATAWASVYHWLNRPDCTDQNLSVGYWQVSRVLAVLKRPQEALHYAEICESYSRELSSFYRGYALEAIARAAALAGQPELAERSKRAAESLLAEIVDPQERAALADDLKTL